MTVLRWLHRYNSEGIEGLKDAPRSGHLSSVSNEFQKRLLEVVRRQPRSLNLEYSMWTLQRLEDFMAEDTGNRLSTEPSAANLPRKTSRLAVRSSGSRGAGRRGTLGFALLTNLQSLAESD